MWSIAGPDQISVTVGPNAAAPGRRLLADSTTTVAVVLHPTQQQVRGHGLMVLEGVHITSDVWAVSEGGMWNLSEVMGQDKSWSRSVRS